MAEHKIIRYNLETRATQLKAERKSYRDIAKILSEESGKTISNTSVQRYFEAKDQAKAHAVEKSDKLKAKVAEAEINTITEAMACVDKLKDICEAAMEGGDHRTAILAVKEIYTGLDIVNKVLGKYQSAPQVQFNFQEVNVSATREKIAGRINSIAAKFSAAEDPQ
jgi:hypothetical protein